ncbi:MAG TPA: L,D-transpeptidase [Pseudonocardia sp.]|jgi:hypothetical protein|nr:L,D-transpeptidase [Pseudonocardia sp.]
MGDHRRVPRSRLPASLVAVSIFLGVSVTMTARSAQAKPEFVEGTPCTIERGACVDADTLEAWLVVDGEVVHGPSRIATGSDNDPQRATPRGDFTVLWKSRDHVSREFVGARMPWAVFFTDRGHAIHEGHLESDSAGCVRLAAEDAERFFGLLEPGDSVQIR